MSRLVVYAFFTLNNWSHYRIFGLYYSVFYYSIVFFCEVKNAVSNRLVFSPRIKYYMNSSQKNNVHLGRNVRRLREIKNIKQESLALSLSLSQQKISKLEQSETIDDDTLGRIADALEISVDAIKNFDHEAIINNTSNNTMVSGTNFNAIEKIIELYERLIESEKDKNAILSLNTPLKLINEEDTLGGYLKQHTSTLNKRND